MDEVLRYLLNLLSALSLICGVSLFCYLVSEAEAPAGLCTLGLLGYFLPLLRQRSWQGRLLVSAAWGAALGLAVLWPLHAGIGYLAYSGAGLLFSLQYAIFGVLFHLAKTHLPRSFLYPAIAVFFAVTEMAFEKVVCTPLALVPIKMIAMFSYHPLLLLPVRYVGGLGLGLIFVYAQLLLADILSGLWRTWSRRDMLPPTLLTNSFHLAVLSLGWLSLSLLLNQENPDVGPEEEFTIIQGDISKDEYKQAPHDPNMAKSIASRYLALTLGALAAGRKNLIWPETATNSFFLENSEDTAKILGHPNFHVWLAGFPFMNSDGRRHNSMLYFDETRALKAVYHKNILVPGVEGQYQKGEERTIFHMAKGKVGIVLCVESLFSDAIAETIEQGAQLIVNPTDEAVFDSPRVSQRTLNGLIIRAVEYERFIIKASQTGPSAVISPQGKILQMSASHQAQIFPVKAHFVTKLSPFSRLKELWEFILMFSAGGLLALISRQYLKIV